MKGKFLLSAKNKMEFYCDAVRSCGGEPIAEYCPTFSNEYDGLILCGGSDINPKYYGEDVNGAINIDDKRDAAEYLLIKSFLECGKPILGICRGMQLLNVYFGGTLIQHLDNAAVHSSGTDKDIVHTVEAERGSILYNLYGKSFSINSFHHQAVGKLGKDLKITATLDGVVESIEHTSKKIFGVQFHPERMTCSQFKPDTVDGKDIFEYFINLK